MFTKRPPDTVRRPARSISSRATTVFAYHAARDNREGDSQRQPAALRRQRPPHSYVRRATICIIGLAIIIGLGYNSILTTRPHVVVHGSLTDQTLLQDTRVYEETATQLLAASIANRNKLTIDTATIATTLQARYPELAGVSVMLPLFGSTPRIEVQPALPVLILKTRSGGTFVIANSGRALASANTVRHLEQLRLPLIDDQSGLPVEAGTIALPSVHVRFVQQVVQQLQARKIVISNITLPARQSQMEVHIQGAPYAIKFNFEAEAARQIGTYLAIVQHLQKKNITPAQYIDVRTLGRTYYR